MLTLSYQVSLVVDAEDDTYDFTAELPDEFALPLTMNSNGALSLRAADVPRMVYRICAAGSRLAGCRDYTAALASDIDLVFDACGRFTADTRCGESDSTIITGLIEANGLLRLNNIPIRTRVFSADSESNGETASPTDDGLLEVDRILVTLATNDEGKLKHTTVILTGSGTIPKTTEAVGGAHFTGTIAGDFDFSPLAIFE